MLAAAGAGASVAAATNPIWLVKTRMQLQSENPNLNIRRYKNSLHCAYMVVREEGIRGLYKGLSASLIGLSESTIQFAIYEQLKKKLKEMRAAEMHPPSPSLSSAAATTPAAALTTTSSMMPLPPAWMDTFLAAASAKLFAATLTYPHEVLRTRLRQSPEANGQLKYTGLVQASKLILKEEGMGAFYGGMAAHLMRVVPNAAIMFLCYELIVGIWS
ncbi:hypothetical protein HK102_004659 [Quaeritorhiza haematococci]|nr:hypothetical protein HK102_004659 [Quaeritorhiza haematococci]